MEIIKFLKFIDLLLVKLDYIKNFWKSKNRWLNIISLHSNGGMEKGECLENIDDKQQIINAIGGKNQIENYITCWFLVNYIYNGSLKKIIRFIFN